MCFLTNERYKTNQTGFLFGRLGHARGVGLGGTGGVGGQKFYFSKFNQIWCVSYSHVWHERWHNIFGPRPWGLWEGPKAQISFFKFQLVNSKDFLKQTLCVFSQMKDINILDVIFIRSPRPSGDRDLGVLVGGGGGGSKILFSEHGHVAYQIKGDDQ